MQRSNSNYQDNNKKKEPKKKRELTPEERELYESGIVDSSNFMKLYKVPIADKVEEKNGLSYLSWADAWCEVKNRFPNAS